MTFELSATRKQMVILAVLCLAILVLFVYWPVKNYEFSNYDDTIYVTKNYLVQQGISLRNIVYAFTDVSTGHWHPLSMISHMLDCQLFRDKAGGHHWSSVIIHILNVALLFLFLHIATGTTWRSAFVAALFAVHPLNVESVAWIAERKNVLSTFFWITTMLLYVWYVKNPGWKRYLPVIFSFALGLMSKSMLVTLPFILLLMDYWPLNRTKIYHRNVDQAAAAGIKTEKISFLVLEKIPLFILSVFSGLLALYAAGSVKTVATLESVPLWNRVGNAIVSYVLYIKKMFWPFDLAVFYPLNHNIPLWHILLAALLIVIITVFVCIYFRRFPYLPAGWFWYLGALVPVIGIVQVGSQSMADRYAYVPLIGLFIVLVWGAHEIIKKRFPVKLIFIIFASIIMALMIIARYQVTSWENSYTLWMKAIKVTRENFLPHKNLGIYLIDINKPREALYHLQKAGELKKNDDGIYNSYGVALANLGKDSEAVEQYKISLTLNPQNARTHNNMGVALMRLGKMDEAEKHFREAIRLGLEFPQSHLFLAEILKLKGHNKEAKYHYEQAGLIGKKIVIKKD